MNYGFIAVLASVLLAAYFVFAADASYGTKVIVIALLTTSFVLPWPLAALLLKVAIVIGLSMYFKVQKQ